MIKKLTEWVLYPLIYAEFMIFGSAFITGLLYPDLKLPEFKDVYFYSTLVLLFVSRIISKLFIRFIRWAIAKAQRYKMQLT